MSFIEAAESSSYGGRKRVLSIQGDYVVERKRPRVSSMAAQFQAQFLGGPTMYTPHLDRLPRARHLYDDAFESGDLARYARPLSGSSSFTASSRGSTPGMLPGHPDPVVESGMALMRSVSVASFNSSSTTPTVPELSAKHYLRNTKITVDFAAPPSVTQGSTVPLSWSGQNILFFSRGNRVHFKNLSTATDDVGQLCKIQESRGALSAIECGGVDQQNIVALGTSKGSVQIWDIASKKTITSWTTKPIASMRWNGPVLTIGSLKGTVKHFDTRIKESPKMKDQARKVTRHQARIGSLAWNVDGKFLASGDDTGTVYCWDSRQTVPLDIGEFVQRRKKIQHPGAITALTWCPWQPKLLASGDSSPNGKGTICLWNVSTSSAYSNAQTPGKLELDSQITSLHFSPHCKELLSTHGPGAGDVAASDTPWSRVPTTTANSVAVHSSSSLKNATTVSVAEKGVAGSVLSPNGMKIALAIPEENKLKVWDVWGKKKEVRRQPSFLDRSSIR